MSSPTRAEARTETDPISPTSRRSTRKWFGPKVRISLIVMLILALGAGSYLFYRFDKYGVPDEFQVHVMRFDGSDQRLLSESISITGGRIAFSPDGLIAFEKEGDICLMHPNGSNEECITRGPAQDELPNFSPDGTMIAFSSELDDEIGIWVMKIDGTAKKLLSNKIDWNPIWSPDGKKIAFTSGRRGKPGIYSINPDGSGEVRLTRSKHESAGQFSEDTASSWSPDGKQIAFDSTRSGSPGIYVMNADGTDQKRIAGSRSGVDEDVIRAAWSPDGKLIAFERGLGQTLEIYVMGPDGSEVRRLTNNRFADQSPSWGPGGSIIAFLSTRSL